MHPLSVSLCGVNCGKKRENGKLKLITFLFEYYSPMFQKQIDGLISFNCNAFFIYFTVVV